MIVQMHEIEKALRTMQNNSLRNYIVPGLTSHLIGGGKFGKVRLFHASRNTRDIITPHSHRFNFTCLVLEGMVYNTIYKEGKLGAEEWCRSTIDQVCGEDGLLSYVHIREDKPSLWTKEVNQYTLGETYSMTYREVHSIEFEKGTKVLFLEGPHLADKSVMIEPWVDGRVVPTFKTEDWMFMKERDPLGAL